jgi:hypothetical protein
MVDLHRVVDHEIDRHERIDPLGVATQSLHGIAHRGKINDRWNAGEVVHQHAGGTERNIALRFLGLESQSP